jgi:hypothetical protein
MEEVLTVDTSYVSAAEIQGIIMWFVYIWVACYGPIRCALRRYLSHDGYCLSVGYDFLMLLVAFVDTAFMFYVWRSNNGKDQYYQTTLWTSLLARFFVGWPIDHAMHGYLGWGLSAMVFLDVALWVGFGFSFAGTDPTTNVGPWLGVLFPLFYGMCTCVAIFTKADCCCSYDRYHRRVKDLKAHETPDGAYENSQTKAAGFPTRPATPLDDETSGDEEADANDGSGPPRLRGGYPRRSRS